MHRHQDQPMDAKAKQNSTLDEQIVVQHQKGLDPEKNRRATDQGSNQEHQRRLHPIRCPCRLRVRLSIRE